MLEAKVLIAKMVAEKVTTELYRKKFNLPTRRFHALSRAKAAEKAHEYCVLV
jgi:hypothetical protein